MTSFQAVPRKVTPNLRCVSCKRERCATEHSVFVYILHLALSLTLIYRQMGQREITAAVLLTAYSSMASTTTTNIFALLMLC